MKALLFFSAFLLLLQSFSSATAAAAASVSLEETCKRVRHDYTFCVTSLQAVPGTVHSTTTIGGFAAVAVNLTRANYTHNLAKASELLKKAKHHSSSSDDDDDEYSSLRLLQALESCFAAYKAGLSDLERAMGDLITKSGSTDVDAALVNLSEAWKRPGECEQAFEERSENIKPLLHKEDALASRLITLSLRITILLVQL